MTPMLEVVGAEYRGDLCIWIEFSDGSSGVVDLESALWGPVFEPLRDPKLFRKFKLSDEFHTIVWENDADFAPEFLRKMMHPETTYSTELSDN